MTDSGADDPMSHATLPPQPAAHPRRPAPLLHLGHPEHHVPGYELPEAAAPPPSRKACLVGFVIAVVAALIGFLKRPPLRGAILAFILLRCALLLTLEAPEQRYTLEFFPPLIALAAVALSEKRISGAAATQRAASS